MSGAFRLNGFDAMLKTLKGFSEKVEVKANAAVRNIVYSLTYNLVMETPQYSGAAASAWRVGVGSPEYITVKPGYSVPAATKGMVGEAPFSKRNRNAQAVSDAMMTASFEVGMYRLGQGTLYISNGLDYAHWFEQGLHDAGSPLRQQNLPHRVVNQVVQGTLDNPSILRF